VNILLLVGFLHSVAAGSERKIYKLIDGLVALRKNALFRSHRDMGLIYQGKPAWIYSFIAKHTDVAISNSKAASDFIEKKKT